MTFPNTFETTSAILPNASLTAVHNLLTAFRNVSEFLYKAMNPATSPAIARTTMPIGFADIAAFNNHCPAAAALVATVCASVAAVPADVAVVLAADATVEAVSAAASAVVAAVLAATFAITFVTTSRIALNPLTAPLTPCPTLPRAMDSGAIAATNNPTLMIVCCCPSSSEPNHSHNALTLSENWSMIGAADVRIV